MRTVSTVRTISLLVIVMLLATLLAACGGAATPTKAPEPTKGGRQHRQVHPVRA